MNKKQRAFVSNLLKKVVMGEITTLTAMSIYPKDYENDNSLDACFLAIAHFEADEELRNKNAEYKEAQDEYMIMLSEILDSGDEIPINIINEYKTYYSETPLYKDNTTNNVIKRLLRSINL